MGRGAPTLTEKEARDRDNRRVENKAKKAARRAITREARANGILPKEPEGWSKGIQKGEYGQDIFEGKVHAKWPHLFKQHLGLIESHIEALDRVMQGMKGEMNGMPSEQKREFELSENSRMRTMCGLMDRARETLISARFASKSIIPSSWQKDKRSLGVAGLKFERLLPKLQEKAEAEGIHWNENKLDQLWGIQKGTKRAASDYGSSSEFSSGESSDDDSDSEDSEASEEENEGANGVESNQFFVVDTKPTPVNLDGSMPKANKERKSKKGKDAEPAPADRTPAKKSKKRSSDDEGERSGTAKKSKEIAIDPTTVDFTTVEAQLQAEVETGLREKELREKAAREEQGSGDGSKQTKEKKRKRSSDGMSSDAVQGIVESFKKKQRLEVRSKKTEEAAASGEPVGNGSKKSKKRKAEEGDAEWKSKKPRANA